MWEVGTAESSYWPEGYPDKERAAREVADKIHDTSAGVVWVGVNLCDYVRCVCVTSVGDVLGVEAETDRLGM